MAAAEIKTLAARRFFIRKLPFAQEHVLLTPMLSNPKNSVTLGESAHYLGSGNHRGECWDVRGGRRIIAEAAWKDRKSYGPSDPRRLWPGLAGLAPQGALFDHHKKHRNQNKD